MKKIALIAIAIAATSAAAQVTIQPTNPSSVDNIVVEVFTPLSEMLPQPVVINGSEIRLTFRGEGDATIGRRFVSLGRLSPGTYSLIVTFEYVDSDGDMYLVVTLPAITIQVSAGYFVPTASEWGLMILAALLAAAGILAIRTR